MSLNTIQLNAALLADMYSDLLVEPVETGPADKEPGHSPTNTEPGKTDTRIEEMINIPDKQPGDWRFLGENRKNILLIVRYPEATYLPDEQLNFLTSVLGACKLSLADVAILNIAHAPSSIHRNVQEKFKSSCTILFGMTPEEYEMPVNFPEFQVQAFNNCTFLYTPVIEKLESDKILKSKLWVCLRKMFGV